MPPKPKTPTDPVKKRWVEEMGQIMATGAGTPPTTGDVDDDDDDDVDAYLDDLALLADLDLPDTVGLGDGAQGAQQDAVEAPKPKPSAEELRYQKLLADAPRTKAIDLAKAATDTGGAEVVRLQTTASAEAKANNWKNACTLLDAAYDVAKTVNDRAPWVTIYTDSKPTISAASNIKVKVPQPASAFNGASLVKEGATYGDEIKAAWEAAKEVAAKGTYDKATAQARKVLAYLTGTVDKDASLQSDREEVLAEAPKLQEKLKSGAGDKRLDSTNPQERAAALKDLKTAALKELARSKKEQSLGVDPSIDMFKMLDEKADAKRILSAEATFKQYDWFEIKDRFHSDAIAKPQMTDLWKFRQNYVTKLIDTQRKQWPGLLAKASGSADLESDIDITFATPKSGDDVKAAKAFNAAVSAKFGKPPGRTFDVNIYIREYGSIKESFNEFHGVAPIKDETLDHSDVNKEKEWKKLAQIDQDVATLLKQRRFLDQEKYDAMVGDLLRAIKAPKGSSTEVIQRYADAHDRARQQYEEAEANYFLTLKEKVNGIGTRLKAKLETTESDEGQAAIKKAIEEIDALAAISDTTTYQETIQSTMNVLEKKFPALVMEATDDMYLDRMAVLRENEAKVRELEKETDDSHDDAEDHGGTPCKTFHKGEDHAGWKKSKILGLKVQIKKDITTNIVFANEAYMSEGAITHVVQTGQASDLSPQEKAEKLKELDDTMLVQSTNEQLADFFKDIDHFSHEVEEAEKGGDARKARMLAGEAYVHASKYVVRMLDAAYVLSLKYDDLELTWFKSIKGIDGDSLKDQIDSLKTRIDQFLYQLRKSGTVPADAKAELAVQEIEDVFGVKDINAFNARFVAFGQELNQVVRAREDFVQGQITDQETQKTALGQREASPREAALKVVMGVSTRPLDVSRADAFKAALETLSVANADALSKAWKAAADATNTLQVLGGADTPQTEIESAITATTQANATLQSEASKPADAEVQKATVEVSKALAARSALISLEADPSTAGASKGVEAAFDSARAVYLEAQRINQQVGAIVSGWQTLPEDELQPQSDFAAQHDALAQMREKVKAADGALAAFKGLPKSLEADQVAARADLAKTDARLKKLDEDITYFENEAAVERKAEIGRIDAALGPKLKTLKGLTEQLAQATATVKNDPITGKMKVEALEAQVQKYEEEIAALETRRKKLA